MRFYYTGSQITNGEQNLPYKSLGGKVSSSLISNGSLNALFGPISLGMINKENYFEVIGIVLKNELENSIENLSFQLIQTSGQIAKFEFAFVAVKSDNKGNKFIEQLPNINSEPYGAEFDELETPLSISGEIPVNGYVGIYIKRTIDKALAIAPFSNQHFIDNWNNGEGTIENPVSTKEEAILRITYDNITSL